ncbi:MAG: DUF2520 domain-containing protein [Planctomycetota bacterium]|jgi:predicted short-subunit dehydrogenase-like oxidoreductase (DUF2520 family)|nr:DUF2520 domain-containing protein [Planctomycetota bacterium]
MAAINIIGDGRVGSTLRALHQSHGDEICTDGDVVIFAVPDDQISAAASSYIDDQQCGSKLFVHLSGVHGLQPLMPLQELGGQIAALHPIMQFVSSEQDILNLQSSFVSVLAGSDEARVRCHRLISTWGATAIDLNDSVERAKYHLALSLASNHVTALLAWSKQLLDPCLGELSGQVVSQMAARAVEAANISQPLDSLTGPVVRGDEHTIQQHLSSLDDSQRQRYEGLLLNLQALVDERNS